jgi:hypothetical protein
MSAGILPADHRTAAFNRQGKRGLCSRKTSAVAGRIDGRIRPLVSRLFTARAQTNHPSISVNIFPLWNYIDNTPNTSEP